MSDTVPARENKPRLAIMDVMKALGMICVVLVHSYCPAAGLFMTYIIMLFFMASGFFWNEKHTHTWKDAGLLILKRFKDLYVPYIIAKTVFLLLQNLFVAIKFLPETALLHVEDIPRLIYCTLACDTFDAAQPFGGHYFSVTLWFLAVLFFIYTIHIVICRLFDKFMQTPKSRTVFYIVLIAVITAVLWGVLNYSGSVWFIRFFACYAAFLLGIPAKMIFSKMNVDKIPGWVWILVFVVSFGAVTAIWILTGLTVDVAAGVLNSVTFYYCCGILGFIANFAIAVLIGRLRKGRLERLLVYIGTNTKPIMTLHILLFKPVMLLYILIFAKPIEYLMMFPVIMDESFLFMWILYVSFAVTVSLLIDKLYRTVRNKIIKPKKAQA